MLPNYSDEIAWLRNRLDAKPSSMLFARLAERYLQLAEVDQAIEVCKKGLRNHVKYPSAYFILAKCLFAQKLYDEAEKQLKKVLAFDPQYLMAHKLYGDLMAEIGWLSSVETSFKKILEIDPMDKKTQQALKSLQATEQEEQSATVVEQNLYETKAQEEVPQETARYSTAQDSQATTFFENPPQPLTADPLLDSAEESDTEFTPQTYEAEESRFSEILDDIFSPYLDEEERRDSTGRSSLERMEGGQVDTFPETPQGPDQTTEESAENQPGSLMEAEDDLTAPEPLPQPIEPQAQPPIAGETEDDRSAPAKGALPNERQADTRQKAPEPEDYLAFDEAEEEKLNAVDYGKLKAQQDIDEQELDFGAFLSSLDVRDLMPQNEVEDDVSAGSNGGQSTGDEKAFAESLQAEETESTTQEEEPMSMPDARYSDTKEKFVTPTLGEIYAAQGQYAKAISVFEILQKRHPENEWYASKLDYLRKRLAEEQG